MKLSEAIRKGCEIAPFKATCSLVIPGSNAACALGAAGLGAGVFTIEDFKGNGDTTALYDALEVAFPELTKSAVGLPKHGTLSTDTLEEEIFDLNDCDKEGRWMTREEIADILEAYSL